MIDPLALQLTAAAVAPDSSAMTRQFDQALEAFQSGDLDRARSLAEEVVQSAPSANAHHLLGLVECRRGNPEAGVPHLRAAVEEEPNNAGFRVMLMRALVDAGRPAEVLEMPEPPPIRSAASLELWRALAEASLAAQNHSAAVAAWSKVAAATPADWRAWANLGNAHAALGEWPQSIGALSKAAELNSAVSIHLGIGRAHAAQLQFAEAESAYARAYALEPADRTVVVHYGMALERNNKIEELARLLNDALANGLDRNSLNYLWAVLARREGRLAEAHDLLLQSEPEADDPVAWHQLRVKLADALGHRSEAFEAAAEMNRTSLDLVIPADARDEWREKTAAYRHEQHELARAITPQWASRVPLLREPFPKAVTFLLGFPRSGTTLLDTFLMGHREIAVLEEEQLVGQAAAGLKTEDLPSKSLNFVRQARARYLRALWERVGNTFSGVAVDKFPLDMGVAPFIQAMFPGAPIIFMQRHPCDVVLSGFMQSFGMVNFSSIEVAADYYDAMMSIWTRSREAMELNAHTVLYEELVEDPEPVLRRVVDFLELEWDPQVLDHQRTALDRGTIVTPSYDQVTEPISKAPRGRWKKYRTQMEPVLPLLLTWAERLGYED